MVNLKLALAWWLAPAALVLILINVIGGPELVQSAADATAIVISAVALAVTAFVLSLKQKSFPLAAILSATGIILMIPPMISTGFFAYIVFPGPIIGVFFGLAILGLGVAKGIGTARVVTAVPR